MVELSKRKAVDQAHEAASKNAKFSDNPILSGKFKKSYDLPLDLLQYRRENSAEYLYS